MKEGFNGQQLKRMPEHLYEQIGSDNMLMALCIYAIGYFPFASHHYINRPNGMEGTKGQYLLKYCIEGNGWYEIEGKHYSVVSNQFFILPMDKPHSYGSEDGKKWTVYWIRFGGSLAPYFSTEFIKPTTIKEGVTSRIGYRQNIFEEMYNVLDKGFTLDNLRYATSLLFTYLGSFKFLPIYRSSMEKTTEAVTASAMMEEIVHFMQENVEKRITLQDLSNYSGFSISQMSYLFRKHIGYAPMTYFNMLKVKRACFLLTRTPLKIHQICYKLGFEDSYYFSRLFKKNEGISPGQYRQNNGSKNTMFLPLNSL